MFLCVCATAQTHRSALFLGNSYTYANDLPQMVKNIASSVGNQFTYSSSTPGGYPFSSHTTLPASIDKVDEGNYDYLILQEQSIRLADRENGFAKYFHRSFPPADFLDLRSKLSDSCHKTLFFLTWGRKEGHSLFLPPGYYGTNYNEMQDNLTENYSQLAEILDAGIAPVGEAWRYMTTNNPEVELYSSDGSHPSVAGTYLAACVFYACIFQEEVSMVWKPGSLSEVTAQKLRTAANEVVTKSWSTWNIDTDPSPCSSAALAHNGDQWSTTDLGPANTFDEIRFTSTEHGYARGNIAGFWQTWNGGDEWTKFEVPAMNPVQGHEHTTDVHFYNRDTAWYAVGADEIDSSSLVFTGINGFKGEFRSYLRVFRSIDGGQNWEERSPPRGDHEILDSALLSKRPAFTNVNVKFDDSFRGSIVCNYGEEGDTMVYTFLTNDGGLSWTHEAVELGRNSSGVWLHNTREFYKSGFKDSVSNAGDPQLLYKTEDGGASWQQIAAFEDDCCEVPFYNVSHDISCLTIIGEDTLLALKSLYAPVMYRSLDGGDTWDSLTTVNLIGEVHDIVKLPNGVYFLVTGGRFGRVMASYNGGLDWELEAHFPYGLRSIEYTEEYIYVTGRGGQIHRKKLSQISPPEPTPIVSSTFKLFPNPAAGIAYIEEAPANTEIRIYDTMGRALREFRSDASGKATLSLSDLSSGAYLIRIAFPNEIVSKRLILGMEN